jgi:hypothetical protein
MDLCQAQSNAMTLESLAAAMQLVKLKWAMYAVRMPLDKAYAQSTVPTKSF